MTFILNRFKSKWEESNRFFKGFKRLIKVNNRLNNILESFESKKSIVSNGNLAEDFEIFLLKIHALLTF